MLSRDGRIGWDCMSAVELWGVVIMGGESDLGMGLRMGIILVGLCYLV